MKKYFRNYVIGSNNTDLMHRINEYYNDYRLVSIVYNPDIESYIAYLELEEESEE